MAEASENQEHPRKNADILDGEAECQQATNEVIITVDNENCTGQTAKPRDKQTDNTDDGTNKGNENSEINTKEDSQQTPNPGEKQTDSTDDGTNEENEKGEINTKEDRRQTPNPGEKQTDSTDDGTNKENEKGEINTKEDSRQTPNPGEKQTDNTDDGTNKGNGKCERNTAEDSQQTPNPGEKQTDSTDDGTNKENEKGGINTKEDSRQTPKPGEKQTDNTDDGSNKGNGKCEINTAEDSHETDSTLLDQDNAHTADNGKDVRSEESKDVHAETRFDADVGENGNMCPEQTNAHLSDDENVVRLKGETIAYTKPRNGDENTQTTIQKDACNNESSNKEVTVHQLHQSSTKDTSSIQKKTACVAQMVGDTEMNLRLEIQDLKTKQLHPSRVTETKHSVVSLQEELDKYKSAVMDYAKKDISNQKEINKLKESESYLQERIDNEFLPMQKQYHLLTQEKEKQDQKHKKDIDDMRKKMYSEKVNKDKKIADNVKKIADKDKKIADRDKKIKDKDNEIKDKNKEIGNAKTEIQKQKNEMTKIRRENAQQIAEMEAQLQAMKHNTDQLLQETYKTQDEDYKAFRNEIREKDGIIKRLNHQLKQTQQEKDSYLQQVQVLDSEKKDLLLRLSKVASANMTYNNPNIADLSDEKRPTKLAEEFSELYDNEWTDAFEEIERENEKDKLTFMLELLMRANQLCLDLSNGHTRKVKESISTLTLMMPNKQEQNWSDGSSDKTKMGQNEQEQTRQEKPNISPAENEFKNHVNNLDEGDEDGNPPETDKSKSTTDGKDGDEETNDRGEGQGISPNVLDSADKSGSESKSDDDEKTNVQEEGQEILPNVPDSANKSASESKSGDEDGNPPETDKSKSTTDGKDGDEETNDRGEGQGILPNVLDSADKSGSESKSEDENGNQPETDKSKSTTDGKEAEVENLSETGKSKSTVNKKDVNIEAKEPGEGQELLTKHAGQDKGACESEPDDKDVKHLSTLQSDEEENTESNGGNNDNLQPPPNKPNDTAGEKGDGDENKPKLENQLKPKHQPELSETSETERSVNTEGDPQHADMKPKKSEDDTAFRGGQLQSTQKCPESGDLHGQMSKDRDSVDHKDAIKNTNTKEVEDTSGTSIQADKDNPAAQRGEEKNKKKIQVTDGSSQTDGECMAKKKDSISEPQVANRNETALAPKQEKKKLESDFEKLPTEQKKTILEATKFFETLLSEDVKTAINEVIVYEKGIDVGKQTNVVTYIEKCIEICWSMLRHTPPVLVDLDVKSDIPFDTNKYKPYTKSGKHLDFLVWPALYLHEGGPLLSKGVAQGK